jgi:hypothetical protein
LAGKCAESFRFGISELAARRVEMVKNSNFAATKIKSPEFVRAANRKTFRYPPGPGEPGRPSAASSLAIPAIPAIPGNAAIRRDKWRGRAVCGGVARSEAARHDVEQCAARVTA